MNITKLFEAEGVMVAFDAEYQAGSKVTTMSHFLDGFASGNTRVLHRTVISGVEAPGMLVFLYRNLGKSKLGKASLAAYEIYVEQQYEGI